MWFSLLVIFGLFVPVMGDPPAQAVETSAETCSESPATPVLGTQYFCEGPDPATSNGQGDIVKMDVPAGAVSAEVVVIGGGGGGGAWGGSRADGGDGARVEATLNMQGIDSLLLTLAGGGQGYWFESNEGDVDGPQNGGLSGSSETPVGKYGRFGSGGHGHRFSGGLGEESVSDANATGGGMSAIVDATGIGPEDEMSVEDVLVIAGGGGGAGPNTSGGDGAADNDAKGGNAETGGSSTGGETPAQGGSAGIGGDGGNGESGLDGLAFAPDSSVWGAGGEHAQESFYPYIGGTGGAGYGGGGAGLNGGGAAGGSFVVESATDRSFMPAENGGIQTDNILSDPGGAGSVTITFFGAPGSPQNLSAAATDGQVAFSWNEPSSDGGATLTKYQYRVDGGDWTDTGLTTSVTVAGDNGTPISFAVRAVNDAGVGDEATISATPATVPTAPRNVTTTPKLESILIEWKVPADDGGSAITGYGVEYSTSRSGPWTDWSSSGTSTTITGLDAGVEHYVRVRAQNAAGDGAWVRGSATAGGAPGEPSGLSASAGDGQVVFEWSAPAQTNGSAVERYEYRVDDGSWVNNGLTLNATISGVNGTAIDFEVRAVNGFGTGNVASITGTPISGPGAPVDLSLSGGLGEIAASWSAPTDNGGSAITGYEVEYSTSRSGPWTDWSSSGTSTTITDLANGTEYYVRVRAQNTVGDGAWVVGSATAGGAPGEPSGLSASAGDGQVVFSWSAPGQTGGSAIERYEYRVDGGSWVDNGLTLNATISGVNGTAIDFQVRAVNGFDTGSAASTTATPVESTDTPGVPSGLEVLPGDGGLSLQWTEPAAGGAPISDFEYSVDGGAWASLNTTGSSADIMSDGSGVSLANGQEYGVRIRARNANGAGDASSSVRQTPGVPLAPGNASGSWEESDFAMSWSAPESNGSPITEYQISISTMSARRGLLIARSGPGTHSTASTSYVLTGLSPQSSYTVTITPRNGHGWGLSSTMSIGSSDSDAEDVVDQTPPAIIHQVPLPPTGTCEDVRDQAFGYQTDITGGWGRSWARWRNNGIGGPICTRMLVYDNSLPGWRLAS